MLQTTLLLMKSLNKTETPIFYLDCVICFQRQSVFYFYYTMHTFIINGKSFNSDKIQICVRRIHHKNKSM